MKGWLNPKIEDMQAFLDKTKEICTLYTQASKLEKEGIHVFSCDEKTGIQAREHKNPAIPMSEGHIERIDPEYIRHGTSGIIASRSVATGEIVMPMVQPTRTEDDFAKHIKSVAEIDPNGRFIFVVDNLNTHKSEAMVRLIGDMENIPNDRLGVKRRSGILMNLTSREAFLTDNSHRISFVYTPKHCSWINQIECWFSIITRRLLNRRASFTSVLDLEQRIHAFIDYYNLYLKKPFQWNYKGKFLIV